MADIQMCNALNNEKELCPLRMKCYRYRAIPDEHQWYFLNAPFKETETEANCEFLLTEESDGKTFNCKR